jgi:asparagine synthase (glutamine-hydrolysing)
MCGIAGFVLWNREASAATARAMCEVIRHRGPDDQGIHVDGKCAIGMRRLSIIDLSTGHQPIANEDGSAWIVFNGEIYNYRELREELIVHGHRFATNSDTETILHLYEQEGVDGIARLRGMFGFSIWDARKKRLILARDRLGKKPLYYGVFPDGLYFGSELKCLREAGVPLEIDHQALQYYFRFSYIPDPWSPYKNVRKLPPGGWLICEADGTVRQGRYWKLPPPAENEPASLSYDQAVERVRELFDESVRIRLMSDVPLGAFLSGGIDSSSVVASMSLQSSEPVKTFSIGFEEQKFNELPYAQLVADKYKTEHHTITVRPNAVDLVQRLVRHFDEPFGDSSAIPTYLVSEFAAQHVKVALSGDGGDELFAGYRSFAVVNQLRRWDRLPQFAKPALSWFAGQLPYEAKGKNYLHMISRPTSLERYFESNYAPYSLLSELLQPEWMLPSSASFLTSTFPDFLLNENADVLLQAFYFEATSNLSGDMLVKVDRMSMANSLEVRCPLLDHKLAEFAATLPPHWKMKNGRGKYILTDALKDRLPEELLTLPKKGFSVPLADWFRGPLRDFLQDHLLSKSFLDRGFVRPQFLRYLINEHVSGRRNNYLWLWRLVFLELWFREHEASLPQHAHSLAV